LVRAELDRRQALAAATAAPELITAAEFARRRSISISTVRAAIRERRLDVTRIGRAVRIAADAQIRVADAAIAEATEAARSKLLRARAR
jgi:excisionase family DNA binding protein